MGHHESIFFDLFILEIKISGSPNLLPKISVLKSILVIFFTHFIISFTDNPFPPPILINSLIFEAFNLSKLLKSPYKGPNNPPSLVGLGGSA